MRVQVLDHGYVELIESWGSEERIIQAARMSTDGSDRGWGPLACPQCHTQGTVYQTINTGTGSTNEKVICPKCKGKGTVAGDEGLLRTLWTKKHMSPFEMAGAIFEVSAPIFVIREWERHRTQGYNELSGRYSPVPDINYMPTLERCMINAGTTNKQAGTIKGADTLTEENALRWLQVTDEVYSLMEKHYQAGLQIGIPKEIARIVMPVGRYSRMRASANLRNWTAFLTLRLDTAAQWEIRQYAQAVDDMLTTLFPRTMELFHQEFETV